MKYYLPVNIQNIEVFNAILYNNQNGVQQLRAFSICFNKLAQKDHTNCSLLQAKTLCNLERFEMTYEGIGLPFDKGMCDYEHQFELSTCIVDLYTSTYLSV